MKKIFILSISLLFFLAGASNSNAATKPTLAKQLVGTESGYFLEHAYLNPNGYVVTIIEEKDLNKIVLFNSSGKKLYQYACKGCHFISATVGFDGIVYASGDSNSAPFIKAINLNGKVKWTNTTAEYGGIFMSPDRQLITFSTHSLKYEYVFSSINLNNGEKIWAYGLEDEPINKFGEVGDFGSGYPFGFNKKGIVSVLEDRIKFIDTSNGRVSWEKKFDKPFMAHSGSFPATAPNGNIAINLVGNSKEGKVLNLIQVYNQRGDLLWKKTIQSDCGIDFRLNFNEKNELFAFNYSYDLPKQKAVWFDVNGKKISHYFIESLRYQFLGVNKFKEAYFADYKKLGVVKFNNQGKLSGQTSLSLSSTEYGWGTSKGYVTLYRPKFGLLSFRYMLYR